MTTLYACSHVDSPLPPLPPSYPSSSSSFSPLSNLYFCEECDAIRCNLCVAVEVASYFCPNCLFDVPTANVRADKNRCARSCFSCPQCSSSLSIQGTDPKGEASSSATFAPGPPYILVCSGCRWSSKEVGWEFEKPTGIALQSQKMNSLPETIQSEYDALKDHLEPYVSNATPPVSSAGAARRPSRHISQMTQMASKALNREVPGMSAISSRVRGSGSVLRKDGEQEKVGWDDLGEYGAKGSWKALGLERGLQDVETMRKLDHSGAGGLATLESRWGMSWELDKMSNAILPQRISLQTKLTKRCPHPNCRHLLIQPDVKSIRMKIKMVAMNYLPHIEIGRKRRRILGSDTLGYVDDSPTSSEEIERRRRERRRTRAPTAKEEDEEMDKPLRAGEVYIYKLALTNPLYDPIQIRLTQPHGPRNAPQPNHHLHIPTQHFTINALKDAWAYDEEDEQDDPAFGGSEAGVSEEGTVTSGTGTGTGTLSKKSRLNVLAGGSVREKRSRGETGVDKKGNTSVVGLEVEVSSEAKGKVEFDLEVRYTYRADEVVEQVDKVKEEYKTFTFWIRVNVGVVV
ncbi:hypothetical protein IAR55_002227 [Kwoniella newhampshirensis]|uniref:Dynactin subunit 4 n=1 Tax=Kwoniella newhampshirensis TaxID=1651941 RepID=A0AAW0YQJ1_9TREE